MNGIHFISTDITLKLRSRRKEREKKRDENKKKRKDNLQKSNFVIYNHKLGLVLVKFIKRFKI